MLFLLKKIKKVDLASIVFAKTTQFLSVYPQKEHGIVYTYISVVVLPTIGKDCLNCIRKVSKNWKLRNIILLYHVT